MTEAGLRYEAAAERRASMLATLRSVGFVSVADLARQLGVSQMTIRRDLHALENGGHVRLVHGGASLTPGALRSSRFRGRRSRGPGAGGRLRGASWVRRTRSPSMPG